jgi:N-acetylmuramoyl-L-alanine amidase CwlA
MCLDEDGNITEQTFQNAAELTAQLCKQFGLNETNLWRHYDITGKYCPAPWVDNPSEFDRFKQLVHDKLNPPVIKEEPKVERVPYDANQFKFLVGLTKSQNQGEVAWAVGELSKMMAYVTNGAYVSNGDKKIEAVIEYSKVFVPVADILDLLGIGYIWDDSTKTVKIVK